MNPEAFKLQSSAAISRQSRCQTSIDRSQAQLQSTRAAAAQKSNRLPTWKKLRLEDGLRIGLLVLLFSTLILAPAVACGTVRQSSRRPGSQRELVVPVPSLALLVLARYLVHQHGPCRAARPVKAITLVFDTDKRGVDIPELTPEIDSNVPGLCIAGKLGGVGLIRTAAEQGRQAVASIRRRQGADTGPTDLVLMMNLQAKRIDAGSVTLRTEGGLVEGANHAVIVCAGGELSTPLLQRVGVQFATKYGSA